MGVVVVDRRGDLVVGNAARRLGDAQEQNGFVADANDARVEHTDDP